MPSRRPFSPTRTAAIAVAAAACVVPAAVGAGGNLTGEIRYLTGPVPGEYVTYRVSSPLYTGPEANRAMGDALPAQSLRLSASRYATATVDLAPLPPREEPSVCTPPGPPRQLTLALDPRAAITFIPELNLLRGTGRLTYFELVWVSGFDSVLEQRVVYGPGNVVTQVTRRSCYDETLFTDTRIDSVTYWLPSARRQQQFKFDVPLRRDKRGVWRGARRYADLVVTFALTGAPTKVGAFCNVPEPRDLARVRTAAAAVARVRAAGFPRAYFAGARTTQDAPRGRYLVPTGTASGAIPCGNRSLRIPVVRSLGPPR